MGSHKLHKRFVINCSTVGSTQPLTPVNSHIGRSQKLLSSGSTLRILHRDLSMKPHQSGIHSLHWNFVIAIVKLWMVVSGCSESLNSQAMCAPAQCCKFGWNSGDVGANPEGLVGARSGVRRKVWGGIAIPTREGFWQGASPD